MATPEAPAWAVDLHEQAHTIATSLGTQEETQHPTDQPRFVFNTGIRTPASEEDIALYNRIFNLDIDKFDIPRELALRALNVSTGLRPDTAGLVFAIRRATTRNIGHGVIFNLDLSDGTGGNVIRRGRKPSEKWPYYVLPYSQILEAEAAEQVSLSMLELLPRLLADIDNDRDQGHTRVSATALLQH